MSDFICPYTCSYRTNSGYCGRTGGAESCQYRMIYHAHGADATVFAGVNMRKPLTNADRIRAMTDEELARLLDNVRVSCGGVMGGRNCMPNCAECWLDWLRQEATDAK